MLLMWIKRLKEHSSHIVMIPSSILQSGYRMILTIIRTIVANQTNSALMQEMDPSSMAAAHVSVDNRHLPVKLYH